MVGKLLFGVGGLAVGYLMGRMVERSCREAVDDTDNGEACDDATEPRTPSENPFSAEEAAAVEAAYAGSGRS